MSSSVTTTISPIEPLLIHVYGHGNTSDMIGAFCRLIDAIDIPSEVDMMGVRITITPATYVAPPPAWTLIKSHYKARGRRFMRKVDPRRLKLKMQIGGWWP